MTKYVIAGNSVAAISATEAIRSVDKKGKITIISPEEYDAYSRPAITYFIAGKTSIPKMRYKAADFYKANNIEKYFGNSVVAIDDKAKAVILSNNKKVSYDKLLLATGGEPVKPPIVGIDRKNVYTCSSLDDAKAIKAKIHAGMRAVVIGGGLIGLKAAEAFAYSDLYVTVVELLDRVLAPILDTKSAGIVEKYLAKHGVKVITGAAAKEITGKTPDGPVENVILNNGKSLPADIVIMAVGVRPRISYVGKAVKINRGIIVNDHMRTSKPDIYAAGDVTEAYNSVTGQVQLNPLWPSAYQEGYVAGLNMAGKKTAFAGNISMNSVPLLGLPIMSVGIFDVSAAPGLTEIEYYSKEDNVYRKLIVKDNILKGAVMIGAVARAGIATEFVRNEMLLEKKDIRALLEPDFDWLDLREDIRVVDLKG